MKLIIFLSLQFLLVTNCYCEEKSESQKENVLEPITKAEISSEPPKIKDQQKEEKPFSSDEIKLEDFKNGTFANVSDCLYFYQRGGLIISQSLNHTNEPIHHLTFEHKPLEDSQKGSCVRNSTHHEAFIELRFALYNNTQKELYLRFNASFIHTKMGYWRINRSFAMLYKTNSNGKTIKQSKRSFKFNCKHIEIPVEFSYSCKNFELESANENERITLKFNNLQMQPFYNKKVFADSFDCSTLFTLGTWMGVLVFWIFTAVIALGVYSLLSIKTMDRFDTKGKLLSLGTIEQ